MVADFFRNESGRLVAILAGVFGPGHLDLVEDVVQETLADALDTWRVRGVPDEPRAWVLAVARNRARDVLRRRAVEARALRARGQPLEETLEETFLETEIADAQMRLVFLCCHPALAPASAVALTLRLACGLHGREIAHALLTSPANVEKRIQRAKSRLRESDVRFELPAGDALRPRLDAVRAALYLLFNEGYHSAHPDGLIRRELSDEAIRLARTLADHPAGAAPESDALLALLLFHRARFDARLDGEGRILLLDEQERGSWDAARIAEGFRRFAASAAGKSVSRYHLEAAIAARHCAAASVEETDWAGILADYDRLRGLAPGPVVELNRAVAVAQLRGAAAGLAALGPLRQRPELAGGHLLDAVEGELLRRLGRTSEARERFEAAASRAPSEAERALLARRLARLAGDGRHQIGRPKGRSSPP